MVAMGAQLTHTASKVNSHMCQCQTALAESLPVEHEFCCAAFRYNDHLLELVVSCLYLAAILGALGSEFTQRRYGRKVGKLPVAFGLTEAML